MGGARVEGSGDVERFPVGRGVIEAQALTNTSGDHAILVSQTDMPRVLILAEPGSVESTGRERVVVMPFDEDVETRVDGDALATWIAAPYDVPVPAGEGRIPVWASGFGFVVVILGIVLMVIGSAVVFSWLLDLLAA
ncbi:MAG: hypothetical protein ACRDE9_05070 [Candidatus Limnocylindria bacterium]